MGSEIGHFLSFEGMPFNEVALAFGHLVFYVETKLLLSLGSTNWGPVSQKDSF
jgi:hypothetical protein